MRSGCQPALRSCPRSGVTLLCPGRSSSLAANLGWGRQSQSFADPLPVCPVPEEPPTATALPEPLQPGERASGHLLTNLFLGHFDQVPTTRHTTGLPKRQIQFHEHMSQLFRGVQAERNEQGGQTVIPDDAEEKDLGIAGEERSLFILRRAALSSPVLTGSTVTWPACDRSRTEATPASAPAPARSAAVGFRAACGWRAGDAERVAVLLS